MVVTRGPSGWRLYEPTSYLNQAEMLFDIEADPYEMNDLSQDPARAQDLDRLRGVLLQNMKTTRDLGLFPDSMRDSFGGVPIYTWVRDNGYNVNTLIDAAWLASDPSPSDLPTLETYLTSGDLALEFWGAAGCAMLAANGELTAAQLPQSLIALSASPNTQIAAAAAEARAAAGDPGASPTRSRGRSRTTTTRTPRSKHSRGSSPCSRRSSHGAGRSDPCERRTIGRGPC